MKTKTMLTVACSPWRVSPCWLEQQRRSASAQRGGYNSKAVNPPRTLVAAVIAAALVGIAPSLVNAANIDINPVKDNTLYQYIPADGDRSNALGNHFFAGKTDDRELRRGVLAFDIAGNVPAGSTITSVTLSLNMSRTPMNMPRIVELHKLLADWGKELPTRAGEEGMGAPATTNDATWRHRFYDTIFWTTQGGDFSGTVSASQFVWPHRSVHVEFVADGC